MGNRIHDIIVLSGNNENDELVRIERTFRPNRTYLPQKSVAKVATFKSGHGRHRTLTFEVREYKPMAQEATSSATFCDGRSNNQLYTTDA